MPLPTETLVPQELTAAALWVGVGEQRTSLIAAFSLRVPVKEVLPGIIKQGVNCLESQGQDTTGNFLLGVGICRGSAKNPLASQVSCLGPRVV